MHKRVSSGERHTSSGDKNARKMIAPIIIDRSGSALCSPVPMFPGTYVPRTYVPRYLCSPVPMFPGTDVPRFV